MVRKDFQVRTFGVEEELLLLDAVTSQPVPAGERAVALYEPPPGAGHQLTTELQQEQLEVVGPPQRTLVGQLAAIRTGRALADAAAARVGARVVALPTAPGPVTPHLVPETRHHKIAQWLEVTAREQLTCGFHVHVAVEDREEGVAVLDRIRVWLPVLLALSANSPFWHGTDTGYASYRYQAWGRWPTAGPTEVFGSADAYDHHCQGLLASGVALDAGMLYFDARLCAHHPTLEVRVADVCLDAEHAAVLATLTRALVETAARNWRAGVEPLPVAATMLRAWAWRASRCGIESQLINPTTGTPAPAAEVVTQLLDLLRPVLVDYEEDTFVEAVVTDILDHGSGARRQREAYARRGRIDDILTDALTATHSTTKAPDPGTG